MSKQGSPEYSNRRIHPRYKVNFRVNWGREESVQEEGEVSDLSVGGCFVVTGAVIEEEALVMLRIDVPGAESLTLWGNVIFRLDDKGFGVRFAAFSQGGARERLARILNEAACRT
jgi:hypothetical protein